MIQHLSSILCPIYMGITSTSSPSLPLIPPARASSLFLPPTHLYRHSSPLVSSPLTPEQAYVKFVPLVVGSCPCWFQQITGCLGLPYCSTGVRFTSNSKLESTENGRVSKRIHMSMKEYPRNTQTYARVSKRIHKRTQEYLTEYARVSKRM